MANPFSLPWQSHALKHPVFDRFNQVLQLDQYDHFPTIHTLNQIFSRCKDELTKIITQNTHQRPWTTQEIKIYQQLHFIDQQEMDLDLYYEQQIFLKGKIPTRLNHYHDFLGACIWILFPRTKMLFNHWHHDQINRYGLKHRSKLRDLITLFDESGLILLYQDNQLILPLFEYDWKTFFLTQKEQWEAQLIPICFGHGLLEQWLSPHPNITAKTLPILMTQNDWPTRQHQWSMNDFFRLDQLIYEHFHKDLLRFSEIFDRNEKLPYRRFSPLPMIGIPNYAENQDEVFYENPKCFKNRKRFVTETEFSQTNSQTESQTNSTHLSGHKTEYPSD